MPAQSAEKHRRGMKILLRVGVLALLFGGGLLFRDRLGGSPAGLQVGDCFDVPTKAGETVNDVQHHPCTEAHTAEVFLLTTHPAAKGANEPTDAQLTSYLVDTCGGALSGYVGADLSKFDLGAFYPTSEDWKNGDRGITCYLTMLDESAMLVSYKSK